MNLSEPSAEELIALGKSISVELLEYDKGKVRLDDSDFLPRYNRLVIRFFNKSEEIPNRIFITVHRDGSKIGPDNYYTVPLYLPELEPNLPKTYAVYSFDSFNEAFKSMRANITTPYEYSERRVSKDHLKRAERFSVLLS